MLELYLQLQKTFELPEETKLYSGGRGGGKSRHRAEAAQIILDLERLANADVQAPARPTDSIPGE